MNLKQITKSKENMTANIMIAYFLSKQNYFIRNVIHKANYIGEYRGNESNDIYSFRGVKMGCKL